MLRSQIGTGQISIQIVGPTIAKIIKKGRTRKRENASCVTYVRISIIVLVSEVVISGMQMNMYFSTLSNSG